MANRIRHDKIENPAGAGAQERDEQDKNEPTHHVLYSTRLVYRQGAQRGATAGAPPPLP